MEGLSFTLALTGASGAIFGRELLHALDEERGESLTAASGRPEMRAARRNGC